MVILPKYKVDTGEDPVIFLAGPIGCAPNWQEEAITLIKSESEEVYIASPRRTNKYSSIKSSETFPRQLQWERYYLKQASEKGCILFWLPEEEFHSCYRTYARDTRRELGEWKGRLVYDKSIRIEIGGEDEFDGLEVIKRSYKSVVPNMNFSDTLEETCKKATEKALKCI